MVGYMLMCKFKTFGPNLTHIMRKHKDWVMGKWTMSATHPLHQFNKDLGKTVSTQVLLASAVQLSQGLTNPRYFTQGTGSTSDAITFSRSSLEAKIATFECMPTNPNALSVAGAIHQLLLN